MVKRDETRVLAVCCFSVLMVGIDVTAVNVALPDLHRSLGSGIAGLQWTIDSYTVVLASMLILSGSLADRIGRKRVLLLGLAIFTAASLLCSIAPAVGPLIAFRALQALGASMLTPVAMSIIANTVSSPRRRAHAIGWWNAVYGISMALGPVIGGLAVSAISWRAIFWINIPVGALGMLLTLAYIPESRSAHPRRLDPVGQLLVMTLLASLIFAIIEAPGEGWTSPLILGAFAVAAVSFVALIVFETHHREPLIEIGLFRSGHLSAGVTIAIAAFACFGGFLFLNTLYLQQVRGLSALHAGLATLPMAAATVIVSPLAGRLVGRVGPRIPVILAGLFLTTASALLIDLSASTPLGLVLLSYVVLGAGFGAVNPPITEIAVAGMPRERAGVAAAISTTSRQVGQALGVAVVGAAVATSASGSFASDSHAGWRILAATGAAVFALGFVASGRTRAVAEPSRS